MHQGPEVHGITFFSVTDLHGRRVRLAIGIADSGNVALALLREDEQLTVDDTADDGTLVAKLAPAEVPQLQRQLGDALVQAVQQRGRD